MKSDSAWALDHMDETLFKENYIKDYNESSVFGKIVGNSEFKSWSQTLMYFMVDKVVDFHSSEN
jgi:hypothetical protein